MERLIGMAVVGGATAASIGLALLLEAGLLRVILGAVARAKLEDDAQREESPAEAYRAMRTVAR